MMELSKRKRLWLMCGIPGSGKSTWIQNHIKSFSDHTTIISRDKIRFSLLKEEDLYFSKEKEVWKEYISQIIVALNFNEDIILDATHLNEASRSKILRALKDNLKNVQINAIVINTPFPQALKQNNLRKGREFVPESVIHRMSFQMTIPTIEEGFDEIYIYENNKYKIITKEDN